MAAYVPGFVQDGVIAGKQIVFPVSKSTQLLFLNGSQYARFAADTGAQLEKLDTWDGFFEMAAAYRQWSQGKPFCALDYSFPQQSYQRLYDVYNQRRAEDTPLSEPAMVGYHARAKVLYDQLRQRQKQYPQRLADGEALDALAEETWQLLCADI